MNKRSVRIVFLTAHEFGLMALRGIVESQEFSSGLISVEKVITLDEKRRSSTVGFACDKIVMQFPELNCLSVDYGDDLFLYDEILKARPDYLFVVGWSRIINSSILDIPKTVNKMTVRHGNAHGCIGMHPTLLPTGRGRAPIPWTIIYALQESGVTAFNLEESADCGLIIDKIKFSISKDETASSLFAKCSLAHYKLGQNISHLMCISETNGVPQNENFATYWKQRRPEDGKITKGMDLETAFRLTRALENPYPNAFFKICGKSIKVSRAEAIHKTNDMLIGQYKIDAGILSVCLSGGILNCQIGEEALNTLECYGDIDE